MSDPRLLSLATALPPFRYTQAEVRDAAPSLFDRDSADLHRLMPVFENAGIERRYSCVPIEWYCAAWLGRPNHPIPENAVVLIEETHLLSRGRGSGPAISTRSWLSRRPDRHPQPRRADGGADELPRRDTRLPIFGLGCAGGVVGLSRAADLARQNPGAAVLFLVVELCALTFRRGDNSKSNIVATALFGDGAAGAIVSTDGDGPTLGPAGEHTWPNSLDIMGWEVEGGRTWRSLFARHSRAGAQRVQGGAG